MICVASCTAMLAIPHTQLLIGRLAACKLNPHWKVCRHLNAIMPCCLLVCAMSVCSVYDVSSCLLGMYNVSC